MLDELHEVRTVDRWVIESGALAVPVSVKAAAADLLEMAGSALMRQRARSQLPGRHTRQHQGLVEPISGHVKMGRRRAVISHLEVVGNFDRAVCLDDHGCGWGKAEHLRR